MLVHALPLATSSNIDSITDWLYYRRGHVVIVYQLFHGLLNITLESLATRNESQTTRGHQWKLQKLNARSLAHRNTFSVRVINDWNTLPLDAVSAESLSSFKARLDHHWLNIMLDIPKPLLSPCLSYTGFCLMWVGPIGHRSSGLLPYLKVR